MTYEIARYRPEFRPGVIELQDHLVSTDRVLNDAYFKWKHEDNPYSDGAIVYVALSGSEVAAMRAFQGARWTTGAGGHASWLGACDLVVDPAHRGQKLFHRIMQFALADLEKQGSGCVLNWSANPITYGASLRAGWHLVAPYATWTHQTARARRVRAWSRRLRSWPLAWRFSRMPVALALNRGFQGLDAAWARESANGALVLEREARAEAMGALVQEGKESLIVHERDAAYYRWRLRNPLCEYRFLYWLESGLRGFLVLQRGRLADGADLRIVDWEAARSDIVEAMLSRLVEAGGYDSLSIWTATLPAAIMQHLQRLGFAPADETRGDPSYRPGLLAIGPGGSDIRRSQLSDAALISDPARWSLRMIYSDAY